MKFIKLRDICFFYPQPPPPPCCLCAILKPVNMGMRIRDQNWHTHRQTNILRNLFLQGDLLPSHYQNMFICRLSHNLHIPHSFADPTGQTFPKAGGDFYSVNSNQSAWIFLFTTNTAVGESHQKEENSVQSRTEIFVSFNYRFALFIYKMPVKSVWCYLWSGNSRTINIYYTWIHFFVCCWI